jgi:translocation and assembly module TamA
VDARRTSTNEAARGTAGGGASWPACGGPPRPANRRGWERASGARARPLTSTRAVALVVALFALLGVRAAHADALKVSVTGIDKELAGAIQTGIGASQYAGRKDLSATQVRVLADDADAQAATALQPYGYYGARVTHTLAQRDGTWQLTLKVAPGPATKVATLDIQMPAAALKLGPVRHAVRVFQPAVGAQLNDATYAASKGAIANALLEAGFLDAKATTHRVDVTRADHSAAIHLHYDVGERYRLGPATFQGSQFRPGFLDRFVPWQPGGWYSQSALLNLQQALTDADYFSIVDVEPEVAKAQDHVVPVKVEVAPA